MSHPRCGLPSVQRLDVLEDSIRAIEALFAISICSTSRCLLNSELFVMIRLGLVGVCLSAGTLVACLNDSELVTREREFRSFYSEAGPSQADFIGEKSDSSEWSEAERIALLNLLWWLGLLLWFAAAGLFIFAIKRCDRRKMFVLWLPGMLLFVYFSVFAGFVWSGRQYHILISNRVPFLAESIALPHHVPSKQGGVSFRFAMVHDVLHERFFKHGPSWYAARNEDVKKQLQLLADGDPNRWPLIDDLAVGLDRLNQPSDAIPLLRNKLKDQEARQLPERDLYTTFANLGTVLIHDGLMQWKEEDSAGRTQLEEGIELIRKAVAANPDAHFGRERWQLFIAEFLLQTWEDESLLRSFDCLGNRLDVTVEQILDRRENWISEQAYGRPNYVGLTQHPDQALDEVPLFFEADVDLADPAHWNHLHSIREYVTRVGQEGKGSDDSFPFDEPMLGIIGMWREGGGANPHFSLAIAETMLRVGQRYLAWDAYERTKRLAKQFSADEQTQLFLIDHCSKRQSDIETTLQFRDEEAWKGRNARPVAWQVVSTPVSDAEIANLKASFDRTLKQAQKVRNDYQAFESQQIQDGVRLDDPSFYLGATELNFEAVPLVGSGEHVKIVMRRRFYAWREIHRSSWMMLVGGAGAMLMALLALRLGRPRSGNLSDDDCAATADSV